ncbi:MAG: phenylalanine--tRNA ligase beta subunit-related protein [Candidatus Shapirobacteria bacterium]
MKIIYSHLKTFLPSLDVPSDKLRDDLTMIGHFVAGVAQIEGEIVFDLDIKINRGDCLGYYGIAKDLSIFYNILLVPATEFKHPQSNYSLPIKIETDNVIRLMAAKIVHIKNKHSPDWLSKFLKLHGVNSINTLVDLTNYVMFMYGLPSHAFDTSKSTDKLIWQMNQKYSSFKSLDGTILPIDKNILMVNSSHFALSLSFWGGEFCAIDNSTTNTIVEIAIYNPTVVRQNRQQLKVTTEAATRLEKFLDPESIPQALNHLIRLITLNCGGNLGSQIFDYYPNPVIAKSIEFDPTLPSTVSGIDIPIDFANNIVTKVGNRPDITEPEDLVEEVVRFYGYNNIPKDQPLTFKKVTDITPKEIYLIEKLKDELVSEGYDEVITWPLVSTPVNSKTVVKTENSINDEVVYLRQSLIPSLKLQLEQYNKYKLPNSKFFEIGKIFYKDEEKFVEKYALGKYDGQNFSEIILDDLEKPENYVPKSIDNNAVELTSQIITLDANVTINNHSEPTQLIEKYSALIDKNILWSMEITDIFKDKYTFRVCYYNCDDKTAKNIHLDVFNLN